VVTKVDGVQALDRAMAILRHLARGGDHGERLQDIADTLELKIPTARRILKALIHNRMVYQVESRRYVMGPLAAELGLAYRGYGSAIARWRPLLASLAKLTGETVYLVGRGGFDSVVLDRVDGTSLIRAVPFEVGQRHALGIGTGSLAILSSLDDEEVGLVLASNAGEYRLHDGLDSARLRSMIEKTRRSGYAITFKTKLMPGVTGFSVALPQSLDQAQFAVSIAFVADGLPLEKRQTLKRLLAREISKIRLS